MKNSFIIANLLQQKESVRLEFQGKADLEAIAQSITAFINTRGGDLVVGIDSRKKIVGVRKAAQLARQIQSYLAESIHPTAPISVQEIPFKKQEVILISVWEGAKKPYQFKGHIYNRVGRETEVTLSEKLPALIEQRRKADFHWERMPVLGADLKDLDSAEMEQTIERYKEYKTDANIADNEDFLVQTGLIQNGNITHAAMLLFGKNPIRFIPQSRIRVTLYPGKTSGNQFLDDKIFEGNIFKNITALFEYLEAVYGKTHTINSLVRSEKSNYPTLAIREGVLNAIIHRDYNSVRGFLQLSVYSDRTEVTNYGALPAGITVAHLKTEHHSILRNPDIAQACFYRKYIEMLGTGTQRMIWDCKERKFMTPSWKITENTTTVIFPGVTHNKISKGITKGINRAAIEKVEGMTDGITEPVRQRLIKMISFIERKKGAKVADLTAYFKVSESTMKKNLKLLIDAELVEYAGSKKVGNYFLSNKPHDKNTR